MSVVHYLLLTNQEMRKELNPAAARSGSAVKTLTVTLNLSLVVATVIILLFGMI